MSLLPWLTIPFRIQTHVNLTASFARLCVFRSHYLDVVPLDTICISFDERESSPTVSVANALGYKYKNMNGKISRTGKL